MFNWIRKNKPPLPGLATDIHSHLLPGLDDGVQSFEQAAEILLHLAQLGYSKVITTPHVMSDAYRNTPEGILGKCAELVSYLSAKGIGITVEAAAEYYLDEELYRKVSTQEKLLTFGDRYLLFETNFITEPLNLKEFIFLATTKGFRPVLAHPERYLFLQQDLAKAEDLIDRGVLFQLNISSFTGHYSKGVQATASRLVDRGWVHFLGSDCHHLQHARLIDSAMTFRAFQKALSLPLLNKTI